MAPVEELMLTPEGKEPDDTEYEGELVADTASEYGVPTINVVETVWSIHTGRTNGAIYTVVFRFTGVVPDCPLAVALTEYVPEAVGLPSNTNVELPEA